MFDSVTSSEKVDKEKRYSDFCIWSLPYPGCEFFKEWRDNGYAAEGMKFDWNQVGDLLRLFNIFTQLLDPCPATPVYIWADFRPNNMSLKWII